MQFISALYDRMVKPEFAIIGAAPCVHDDLLHRPIESGKTHVIVLNSAFKVYQDYDAHMIANREFLSLYAEELTKSGIAVTPNSFMENGYDEQFRYYPSRKLWREQERLVARNDSLVAGHSALLPALHFALRCCPKHIVLYGIDMSIGAHWDDGKHETVSYERFPAWRKCVKQMATLRTAFPHVEILVMNHRSVFVTRRVLRCAYVQ